MVSPGMMFFAGLIVVGYGVMYGDTWLIWLGAVLALVSVLMWWQER